MIFIMGVYHHRSRNPSLYRVSLKSLFCLQHTGVYVSVHPTQPKMYNSNLMHTYLRVYDTPVIYFGFKEGLGVGAKGDTPG